MRNSQTKIVGILNLTPDSFSDGGKYDCAESALKQLELMLNGGAEIIDIGGESSRPNAKALSDQEEFSRLENILPKVINKIKEFNNLHQKQIKSSIDSYHFSTVVKSYEMGIDIVNDISGLIDEKIVEFVAKKNITTILMHNLAIHANPNLIVNQDLNINHEILKWAQHKIIALQKKGVKKSQLIFDPGIGFSKNARQSLRIIKNIEFYRQLELPIMVGHSKKSCLDDLDIEGDRAVKTLIITKFLSQKKVDYVRVHDVLENFKVINNF